MTLIEKEIFVIPQEKANTIAALQYVLADTINKLIAGSGIVIMPSDIVILTANFLPAIAGDAGKPLGTNGFFEFRVSKSSLISAYSKGTIKATPFDPTSNEILRNGALKAWTSNGTLYVSGLTEGGMLSVYSVTGTLVYRNIIPSETADIPLAAKGIYFVRQGSQTVKVVN